MEQRKKAWIWIVIAAVVIILILLVGGFWIFSKLAPERLTELYTAATDRLLFTKTIHDFPGHMIDNLDDSETENFVVYAKGVTRVDLGDDCNILVSVNTDASGCVFASPNEQVTSLRRGDVFFVEPSEQCISGFAMKVGQITIEGDQAVITGKAPGMRELVKYADVDMEISLQKLFIEESDVPYTLSWEDPVDEQALWDSMSEEEFNAGLDQLGYSSSGLAAGQNAGAAQVRLLAASNADDETAAEEDDFDSNGVAGPGLAAEASQSEGGTYASSPLRLSTRFEYIMGNAHGSGELGLLINHVQVIYKFHPLLLSAQMRMSAQTRLFFDAKLGVRMTKSWMWRIPKAFLPICGPFTAFLSWRPSIDISGGVYGHFSFAADTGAEAGVILGPIVLPSGELYPLTNTASRISFNEIEAQIKLSALRTAVGVGVPGVAEVGMQCTAGLVADARLLKEDELGEQDDGTYHDCDACVDGDIDWFGDLKLTAISLFDTDKNRMKALFAAKLPGVGASEPEPGWHFMLLELRGDLPDKWGKFYVSFRKRNSDKTKVETDFGDCPYNGTRYAIQVTSDLAEKSIPHSNFLVKLQDEEGDAQWELTDEEGIARFMLSPGRYQLLVTHGALLYTETLYIGDNYMDDSTPRTDQMDEDHIDKRIKLNREPKVYVVLCHDKGGGKGNGNPSRLLQTIMGNTPYTLVNMRTTMSDYEILTVLRHFDVMPGDIVVDLWYHESDTSYVNGDRWRNSGFIMGFFNLNIGRVLQQYGGVNESTGNEIIYGKQINWWVRSYNCYFSGNRHINGMNFHDDFNRSDDTPPSVSNLELRFDHTVNVADDCLYDAAYCILEETQVTQQYLNPYEVMGSPGFWGVYNNINGYKNNLINNASRYSGYITAAVNNQDFGVPLS